MVRCEGAVEKRTVPSKHPHPGHARVGRWSRKRVGDGKDDSTMRPSLSIQRHQTSPWCFPVSKTVMAGPPERRITLSPGWKESPAAPASVFVFILPILEILLV